tara:strand:- start:525 stop:710 length:186 start_codon:yes stop_codon:yes gene_type:complete
MRPAMAPTTTVTILLMKGFTRVKTIAGQEEVFAETVRFLNALVMTQAKSDVTSKTMTVTVK